jgi:hypothetical protein
MKEIKARAEVQSENERLDVVEMGKNVQQRETEARSRAMKTREE